MTGRRMTDEREAELRDWHFESTRGGTPSICLPCGVAFPCNIIEVLDALAAERAHAQQVEGCVMTHTPPYDFAQCETHDTTFPLGEACKFQGRDIVDVYADEAQEQRVRAVRAELERDRAIERAQQVEVPHSSAAVLGYVRLEHWAGGWDIVSGTSPSDSLDDMDLESAGEVGDGDPGREIVAAVVRVGADGRIGS